LDDIPPLEDYAIAIVQDGDCNLQNQTIAVYNFASYPQIINKLSTLYCIKHTLIYKF